MTRRKKPAKKRNSEPRKNVSVEELIALAEQRLDSEEAKKAFDDHVAGAKPGTVGAAKLVTAGDALEDEDLLLDLARKGFLEALRSHTLRRKIVDETEGALDSVANDQAAVGWSSPDDRYPGAWIVAEFGGSIAVNGELLGDDDKIPERPENYVLTDFGGSVPVTEEIVHPTAITKSVIEGLGLESVDGAEKVVLDVLDEASPHGIPVSVSGDSEIWMDEASVSEEAEFDISRAANR